LGTFGHVDGLEMFCCELDDKVVVGILPFKFPSYLAANKVPKFMLVYVFILHALLR
jgi:hypothetical protein